MEVAFPLKFDSGSKGLLDEGLSPLQLLVASFLSEKMSKTPLANYLVRWQSFAYTN